MSYDDEDAGFKMSGAYGDDEEPLEEDAPADIDFGLDEEDPDKDG